MLIATNSVDGELEATCAGRGDFVLPTVEVQTLVAEFADS